MNNKVKIPSGQSRGRIICSRCGNSQDFVELTQNVNMTTLYRQNNDGSFSPIENETEIQGDIMLLCSQCGANMTRYHRHLLDMIF